MDPADQKTSALIFVEPYLDHIAASETLSDLRHFFAFAYRHAVASGDADALARIVAAKDLRKAQLQPAAPDADPPPAPPAPPAPPEDPETLRAARLAKLARAKAILSTPYPQGKLSL